MDIAMRAQKKLLGRMATKNVAKMFIDDISARILDNLHRFLKMNCASKKEAEKVVKNMIKIVVKMGILDKNGAFNELDLDKLENFKELFRTVVLTLVSFHEVAFSYERNFLTSLLNKCRVMLKDIVERHLSNKSLQRIDMVFDLFCQSAILDSFFNPYEPESLEMRSRIITDMTALLESRNMD